MARRKAGNLRVTFAFGVKLVRTFRARHHDDGIAGLFARFLRNSVIELCSRNGPRARVRGMVCCLGVLLRRTRRRDELL
jgi:hypothetical protein